MSALGGGESVSLGVLDSEKACLEIGAFFRRHWRSDDV